MGYESCLEAAGATVHDFIQIGDYQGTWYAFLTFKGVTGFVSGSYGSCSGCDAYDAECESHWNDGEENREENKNWKAKFGLGYLDNIEAPGRFVRDVQENCESAYSDYRRAEYNELLEWVTKVTNKAGVTLPTAIAPFRATFQYDFGVVFNSELGTPTEPGRQYVFDKIRAEIDDIGLENWLEANLFGIRPNG